MSAVHGRWTMTIAFSAIAMRFPAMATSVAAEAAIPSMWTVTFAGNRATAL
ncbi:MAG: hypothetical protein HMLKMBBP_03849 [Planctomycetes bacterium]|nr:hypothetical protein [Planctomycetota bacterium]